MKLVKPNKTKQKIIIDTAYFTYNLKVGDTVRIKKTFSNCYGGERILHEKLHIIDTKVKDLGSKVAGEYNVGIAYCDEYPNTPLLCYHLKKI